MHKMSCIDFSTSTPFTPFILRCLRSNKHIQTSIEEKKFRVTVNISVNRRGYEQRLKNWEEIKKNI